MQGLVSDYKIFIKYITNKIGKLKSKINLRCSKFGLKSSSHLFELPLSPFWPWGNVFLREKMKTGL